MSNGEDAFKMDRGGRCLDVGSGPESVAAHFYPNMQITRLDADPALKPDIVHNIIEPLPPELHGQFDLIYMSHVLEHLEWRQAVPALKNLREGLKEGGEVLILVPSLEWAAEQSLSDMPTPVLNAYLYGSQTNEWQFHKSGYTLVLLRQVLRLAGFVESYLSMAGLDMKMGPKIFKAMQNVAVGRANGHVLTAADSIE